jgi:hypothetical protein
MHAQNYQKSIQIAAKAADLDSRACFEEVASIISVLRSNPLVPSGNRGMQGPSEQQQQQPPGNSSHEEAALQTQVSGSSPAKTKMAADDEKDGPDEPMAEEKKEEEA